MLSKWYIAIILSILTSTLLIGQSDMDKKLAFSYYEEGQFDKALVYFEKVYPSDNSTSIYEAYLDCLIYLKDFKNAHKLCKKQVKSFPLITNSLLMMD